jgi:hypothetical protein
MRLAEPDLSELAASCSQNELSYWIVTVIIIVLL